LAVRLKLLATDVVALSNRLAGTTNIHQVYEPVCCAWQTSLAANAVAGDENSWRSLWPSRSADPRNSSTFEDVNARAEPVKTLVHVTSSSLMSSLIGSASAYATGRLLAVQSGLNTRALYDRQMPGSFGTAVSEPGVCSPVWCRAIIAVTLRS
jgi:hypothetical protein